MPFKLRRVETLVLSNNPFKKLFKADGMVIANDEKTKHLYLSHCGFQDIDMHLLYYLDDLETLDLSFNSIESPCSPEFSDSYYENDNDNNYGMHLNSYVLFKLSTSLFLCIYKSHNIEGGIIRKAFESTSDIVYSQFVKTGSLIKNLS